MRLIGSSDGGWLARGSVVAYNTLLAIATYVESIRARAFRLGARGNACTAIVWQTGGADSDGIIGWEGVAIHPVKEQLADKLSFAFLDYRTLRCTGDGGIEGA